MIEIPFWKLSSCVQDWIVTFQLRGAKKKKKMELVTAVLVGQEFLLELYS